MEIQVLPSVSQLLPIRGRRVHFEPLQRENIYTHFRWNNDPELNRLDSEIPYEEESFGAFKKRFEQMCDAPSPGHRDFEVHVGDKLVGVAYIGRINPHHAHALVGLTIGNRSYWGEGYGRESMGLLLDVCFDRLNLHRVRAETFEYNTAWRDLVEGMGFTKEGTARDYLYRDGAYWDKESYGLLAPEYNAAQA
ncbi:GNAT family N-acetyltransferase [Salisaeta longa]|uniref:GNAT family N-acetyltransferase n=1 Tax=Salisaeta longa TaxID=503170 RepID=UPI0003B48CD3|nr:GNAT family protein [Salisaeta longa]